MEHKSLHNLQSAVNSQDIIMDFFKLLWVHKTLLRAQSAFGHVSRDTCTGVSSDKVWKSCIQWN